MCSTTTPRPSSAAGSTTGAPGAGYPWPWSVYRWLDGTAAHPERIADLSAFAADLAAFLNALQQIDSGGGPPPGPHSFFRGAPLEVYDDEMRRAIVAVCDLIDADAATRLWEADLAAPFADPPVWFHGDVAINNLLVQDGRLSAVIDFGCCGVGDPACDLAIAWTLFSGASRAAFRAALPLDIAACVSNTWGYSWLSPEAS